MWSEVVVFSSLLSGGSAGKVEFMIPLRILQNTTEQLAEATLFWFLRYIIITKPGLNMYMRIANWRTSPANTSVMRY